MPNEFFVERYAKEKHQAHLAEAARDRLLVSPRRVWPRSFVRAQAAVVLAAIAVARAHTPFRLRPGAVRHGRVA